MARYANTSAAKHRDKIKSDSYWDGRYEDGEDEHAAAADAIRAAKDDAHSARRHAGYAWDHLSTWLREAGLCGSHVARDPHPGMGAATSQYKRDYPLFQCQHCHTGKISEAISHHPNEWHTMRTMQHHLLIATGRVPEDGSGVGAGVDPF